MHATTVYTALRHQTVIPCIRRTITPYPHTFCPCLHADLVLLPLTHHYDLSTARVTMSALRTSTVTRLAHSSIPALLASLPPPHHCRAQHCARHHQLSPHSVAHQCLLEHAVEGRSDGRWQLGGRAVGRRRSGVERSVLPRLVRQVGHGCEAGQRLVRQ